MIIFTGVTSFNGYSGCLKCTTTGKYSHLSRKMIFPDCKAPLRNDKDFRAGRYPVHQKSLSILAELPIDLIEDFPIADSLHIIDLGWTKRFLSGLKSGNLWTYSAKWSVNECNEVSIFLKKCIMPSEINRPVRGLEDLPHWKGTEFRTFLLYVSLVVLKKFIKSRRIYEHFLLYFCAIHICHRSDQTERNYEIAQAMLMQYLDECKKNFGIQLFSSNLHNLCHLVQDVKKFGPLQTFSAYPFESRLYYLKRLLRSGVNPLPQVARRISEVQSANCFKSAQNNHEIKLMCERKHEDVLTDRSLAYFLQNENAKAYSKIQLPTFKLNASQEQNKWVHTISGQIVCVKAIIQSSNGQTYIYGCPLLDIRNYFEKPVLSSKLNIYESNCAEGSANFYQMDEIHCKMVKVEYGSRISVFVPLVHTIQKK